MITKGISIFSWAYWPWLLEAQVQMMVSSVFGILGLISPSSEQTPILRLPFRDRNTGMPFFLTVACVIWHLVNYSCLPLMRLTPKEHSMKPGTKKKEHLIPQDKRARKWRVRGNPVYWEHERCKHAYECWGKLTPEINYSINFPNTGVEIMLLQSPLFFQCQNSVSHLFKNPKYSLDYEIEHESSITDFTVECHTKTC